ncbi:hypothetical protein OROGR_030823 [Orobanche gracilis]
MRDIYEDSSARAMSYYGIQSPEYLEVNLPSYFNSFHKDFNLVYNDIIVEMKESEGIMYLKVNGSADDSTLFRNLLDSMDDARC